MPGKSGVGECETAVSQRLIIIKWLRWHFENKVLLKTHGPSGNSWITSAEHIIRSRLRLMRGTDLTSNSLRPLSWCGRARFLESQFSASCHSRSTVLTRERSEHVY